jgi:hypothetical protein
MTLLPLANSELAKSSIDKLTPLRDFRLRSFLHIATHVLPVHHHKKLYEPMRKDLLHRESCIVVKQIKYACFSPAFGAHAPFAKPSPVLQFAPADDREHGVGL